MEAFFRECASAGALQCPFYAPTPGAISQKLEHLLQSLREKPIPVRTDSSYGIVDYPLLRYLLFLSLNQPYGAFPLLAKALSDLEKGDGVATFKLAALFQLPGTTQFQCSCDDSADPLSENFFEAQLAIICTDGAAVQDDLEDLHHYYQTLARQSKWAEIWARIRIGCSCVYSIPVGFVSIVHHSLIEDGGPAPKDIF
jgi:hypothetical protein